MPLPNNGILVFMGLLDLGLFALGEATGSGAYFLASIIPTIYMMAEIHQWLFSAFGFLLIAVAVVRTIVSMQNGK